MEYGRKTIILPIVLASSIVLAIFSYNYFTQSANQIQELAINDLQTNAEIEAYSISNSLSNAISVITSNLRLIANSPSILEGNISKIQTLINIGQETTNELTDGFYILDSNGTLVTFTGIEKEENAGYKGIDLSHRAYFQIPKQDKTPYISTVIDSNDNIPRMYLSFPILESNQTRPAETDGLTNGQGGITADGNVVGQSNTNSTSFFKGVVVASIEAKTLGNFLESQIHPKLDADIAFIDRNGTIIYTQNQTFIGKDYFGNDFQSYVKTILKDRDVELNNIINKALHSGSGLAEFSFGNSSTTIAHDPVLGHGINSNPRFDNRIGTLFITIPHTLAADVASIIDSQRTTNFSIIASIAAIASVIAVVLLRWNKTLQRIVMQKTSQLQETVDKLRNANDELKHHDQIQKEFINVAAHELRTPTQAISGNLELIEMMYLPSLFESPQEGEKKQGTFDKEFDQLAKDKDKQQRFRSGLVSTYRNSQRLERLVNNILDVSRIESKKLQLDKEHFNLNEKIRNVIKDIYGKQRINSLSSYREKFINIDFQPSEDPITVYADKIRIFEVISNLLTNAIKYSNGKPVIITVKKIHRNTIDLKHQQNGNEVGKDNTKGNKDETFVVVSIRDKGKGINLEILPRLFTKFTTKSSQGTGLGLYLAKSIIEAHGGQIWAQNNSDEEKGATFSFTLPLDN